MGNTADSTCESLGTLFIARHTQSLSLSHIEQAGTDDGFCFQGDDINGTICSAAELCVGILAACIATWRPLFSRKVRRPATCTRGLGKCHGNSASVGNTPSDQPSRTKITVNANGMIGRVKNDSDDKRLYTRMEEFEVEPVDERW